MTSDIEKTDRQGEEGEQRKQGSAREDTAQASGWVTRKDKRDANLRAC